ncbi:hypothetical protein CLV32_0081 [Pedobacter duraquae]|uniref:Uncharacterized protein n=2 Tax=Pedobacter duraquae TaxID=425511 RepID=A0A4R6IP70_9SPHI|nr:hypothetical protein CLV32_0081 [Pedobacter duraquae]
MNIAEILKTLNNGTRQQLELMARTILTRGRSHADMKELSRHASEFNDKLLRIENKDQDYLALLFILAQHLNEINLGSCACSIVEKPMYNSPERLEGILEILSETFNEKEYAVCIHSRCLACGKEYESKMVDSGFGQKVIWKEKVQRS